MGEMLALLALVFLGGSKKKASSSSTSMGWSGRIGAAKFSATGIEGLRVMLGTEAATAPIDVKISAQRNDGAYSFEIRPSTGGAFWVVINGRTPGVAFLSAIYTHEFSSATASPQIVRGDAIEALLDKLDELGDDSKLPDNDTPPPASSPNWSGRIGAMQFTVTRGTGAWVCKINGSPSNHATAFLALRNALLVSSANAAKTAGLFLIAEPFVFEANATRMPGVVEQWKWHVRVPEAGTTILDGANDAMAEGTEPNRNDALGAIASWARPYTEGQTAHG